MKNLAMFVLLMFVVSCSKEERSREVLDRELNHDTFGLHLEETKRDIDFVPLAAPTQPLYEQSVAVILLDFDGGIVPPGPWSNSGVVYDHAGLTVDEQQRILDSVSYDYRIFKNRMVVTTDESIYFNANPKKRSRLILSITFSFYGSTAGGVAYTGSMKWGNDTPCFVFTSLLKYNIKHIQEAASHEIGHTLGLRHQAVYDANCNKTSDYNYGTPELGWIMGVGYNCKRVEFGIGPTPYDCKDIQNDTLIINQTIRS